MLDIVLLPQDFYRNEVQKLFSHWTYILQYIVSCLQHAFQPYTVPYTECCSMCFQIIICDSFYLQCGTLYLGWLGEFAPKCECEKTPAWRWEAPLFCGFQEKRWGPQGNRYVWEEDPCQEHGASLIWRQVLFWWVHKQFTSSLEVVHFTRLFKDLWHLRRASEANNPTFRMWVFPLRSIPDRNIK